MIVAAATVPALSSCLISQKDVFDEDPATRMTEYLADVKNVLKSNDTWIMYYFPHEKQDYGGTINFLSFTDEEVTAAGEVSNSVLKKGSAYTETSLYKLTTDNGPVLSFDTKNSIIQYWGTPSGTSKNLYGDTGLYQGHRGDFEFTIIEAQKDIIVLKGKRSGVYAFMQPFDGDYVEYLDKMEAIKSSFVISRHSGTIGTTEVKGDVSFEDRQISFNYTEGGQEYTFQTGFAFTDKGIMLYYNPVIGGQTVTDFDFNTDTFVLTSSDKFTGTLQGATPDGWLRYEDFIGDFSFTYTKGTFDVTIEQGEYRKTLLVKGINSKYDVVLNYNLNKGIVSLMPQRLGNYDSSLDIWIVGWDNNAGYVSYSTTVGMDGTNSFTEDDKLRVTFSDNKVWKSYNVRGYLLRLFVAGSSPASGTNKGNASASKYKNWWFVGATNHQVADITSLTKK